MKKTLLVFTAVGLLFFASQMNQAHAAISLVQSTSSAFGRGTSPVSIKLGTTTRAGDLLLVWTTDGESSATTTVTDNAGNTYAPTTPVLNNTGCSQQQELFYAKNIVATSTPITVKITYSSVSAAAEAFVFEYSGISTTNPLDATSTRFATMANGSTSAVTLTGNPELAFSGYTGCSHAATAGAGYTTQILDNGDILGVEDQRAASGTIKGAWTNASQSMSIILSTFKASSGVPPPPTIASFSASPVFVLPAGTSTLSWNTSNASSVAISAGGSNFFSTSTLIGSTTVNPTSTTLYTLTASNPNGTSTATSSVSVDLAPPTTPTSVTAVATGTSTIKVSWASSTDVGGPGLLGYDIFRCTDASCAPSAIVATSSGVSYTDSGLTPSTSYTYAVAAYDVLGLTSATSTSVSTTTQSIPPPPPPAISSFAASSSLVASAGTSTLSWNTSNASSVAISAGGSNFFSTATLIGSTTVNPTSTTVYILTATNPNGTSTATTTVTVGAGPSAPGSLTVTGVTTSTVSLSWASSTPLPGTSIAFYSVYSGIATSSMNFDATTTENTFTDMGLATSTTHFYYVTAQDNLGEVSASSSVILGTTSSGGGGSGGVPTLVQHIGTNSNEDDSGSAYTPGNPYYLSLPNNTLAGNTLVLAVSYPYTATRTVAVSDNEANTWILATSTPSSPTAGQIVSRIYYAPNVASGTQKVTVTFNTGTFYFQAELSEFYNVATVSALDGASAHAGGSGPNLSSGSFTTGSAGDLIYSYAFDTNQPATGNLTSFTAGSGFALLSADDTYGSVAEYQVQSSTGAINPSFTATGTTDPFNVVSVALKGASAGTAPGIGIRIVHVYHELSYTLNPLQFPSTGNLLVCNTSISTGQWNITGVTSTPSNTWIKATTTTDYPQIFYAANANTSSTLTFRVGRPSGSVDDPVGFVCYDITGAATIPYDATAGIPSAGMSNTNNSNLVNMPNITPSAADELIFSVMNNGIGPTIGMAGGTPGLIMDNVTYGGELDSDQFDNGDGYAHYYAGATSTVNFGWAMATPTSSLPEWSSAAAIGFEAVTQ